MIRLSVITVCCDRCVAELDVVTSITKTARRQAFVKGWRRMWTNADGTHDVCPTCVAKRTPMPRIARRHSTANT